MRIAGGFMSYGANQRAAYVRLAAYADKLLRGAGTAGAPHRAADPVRARPQHEDGGGAPNHTVSRDATPRESAH